MQLSVVIPFYQVEKYIGACLDALAALPAEESEILLVDDCGRDGSAAIAAAYCAAVEEMSPRLASVMVTLPRLRAYCSVLEKARMPSKPSAS